MLATVGFERDLVMRLAIGLDDISPASPVDTMVWLSLAERHVPNRVRHADRGRGSVKSI